jgi:acyl-CoA dehydrogenase
MTLFERIETANGLTKTEAMVVRTVRDLAHQRFLPRAAGYDRNGDFPWENVADLKAIGLNGVFLPEEHGGAPLSYAAYLECVRAISAACASTGIIWATVFHAVKPILEFGTEAQKQRLLPTIASGGLAALVITEETAGSDATGMQTRFTPDGDMIRVTGNKLFITNGDVADLYFVFGKWSEIADSRAAISAVVIEKCTPGLSVLRKEDKMGLRASSTAALAFQDCRVPRANLVGAPGAGLGILLRSLNRSRPSIAAHALGIAEAAFDEAVRYVNQRRQSGRRIVEFQGIQFLLADLASELALTQSWLSHVARLADSGVADISIEASIAKMRASDLAMRMTTEAVQLFGGYGYCKGARVEQLMRDAKITQIWEGTNQIHRQLIGRSLIEK